MKDYNNLLEEILDRKTFPSIAKNLFLSMIYKLEIAYKDYSEVNVDAVSKDVFLGNILDNIKNYCDNVKIVEPESSQAMLLEKHNVLAVTNTRERSVLSYTTENAMFCATCDIEPKYFFIKDDFLFKNVLQKLLVKGYVQNNIQILKNFNGWSWDVNLYEKMDYIANIIYQNIMMIKGEQFLYDWRTDNQGNKDYLAELKRSIKKVTGNDNYYLSLCKLLYKYANKNDKAKIKKELEIKEIKYKEFFCQPEEVQKENIKEFNKLKTYYLILNNEKNEYEELVNLQKCFLSYIEKKVQKITQIEEILEIIYRLRYYQNIIFYEGILLKDYEPLNGDLSRVIKIAITKACKLGAIKIISMDINTNFEIIKYVLDTRIIELEEIKIYLDFENDNIIIKVYDKEVFEKQGKIKFEGNKKDIAIKKKKTTKLFN